MKALLWSAIYYLATSAAPIQERLDHAASELLYLRPEELPEDLREEFEDLLRDLTAQDDVADEGNTAVKTSRRSDAKAERLARRIFDLYTEIRGSV